MIKKYITLDHLIQAIQRLINKINNVFIIAKNAYPLVSKSENFPVIISDAYEGDTESIKIIIEGNQNITDPNTDIPSPSNPKDMLDLDGITIYQRGNNLLDDSYSNIEFPYIGEYFVITKQSDGGYHIVTDNNYNNNYPSISLTYDDNNNTYQPCEYLQGKTLYASMNTITNVNNQAIAAYPYIQINFLLSDNSLTSINYINTNVPTAITVPNNAIGMRVLFYLNYMFYQITDITFYPLITLNENNTTPSLYFGFDYEYDWSENVGKIYNGNLNPSTGELVVTGKVINGADLDWSINRINNNLVYIQYDGNISLSTTTNILYYNGMAGWGFNVGPYQIYTDSNNNYKIMIILSTSDVSTDEDIITWMENNDLKFYIQVSETYQLTPQTVHLQSGTNMFFIDRTNGNGTINFNIEYQGSPTNITNSIINQIDGLNTTVNTINTTVNTKLDSNQGVENSGKFLIVGNNGVVTPTTIAEWQGGSF